MKRPAVVCPPNPRGIEENVTTPSSLAYRTLCLALALLLAALAFFPPRRSLTFEPELRAWDMLFRIPCRPPVSAVAVSARGMGVSPVTQTADADGVSRRTRTGWVSPIAYPASRPLPEPSKLSGSTGVVPGLPVITAMLAFNVNKEDLNYAFGDRLLIAGRLRPPVLIPIDGIGS